MYYMNYNLCICTYICGLSLMRVFTSLCVHTYQNHMCVLTWICMYLPELYDVLMWMVCMYLWASYVHTCMDYMCVLTWIICMHLGVHIIYMGHTYA